MAFRRRSCLLAALLSLAFLAGPATADRTGQIAVFWGRNKDEGSLREACDTGLYTTVIISFYSVFGHGTSAPTGATSPGTRSTASATTSSTASPRSSPCSSPSDVADNLWNAHLGGSRKGVFRPFGDAVVDGIDFFIDQGSPDHYDELARHLSSYNKYYRGRVGVLLTATTRCAYPDKRVEKALATGVFDRIHVRLYGDVNCTMFPDQSWGKWAAAYPRSQVYLGLLASPEADGDAYIFPKDLYYGVLPNVQNKPNYGGIMIWNRYYDKKTGYSSDVSA